MIVQQSQSTDSFLSFFKGHPCRLIFNSAEILFMALLLLHFNICLDSAEDKLNTLALTQNHPYPETIQLLESSSAADSVFALRNSLRLVSLRTSLRSDRHSLISSKSSMQ